MKIKIVAKAIAYRIKKLLLEIINSDQTDFLKGRFILGKYLTA